MVDGAAGDFNDSVEGLVANPVLCMRWEQSIQYASRSDIGFRRENNEDSLAAQICKDEAEWKQHGHLFLVADGMGGHAVGELASKIAADTIPHTFFKSRETDATAALKNAIEVANRNINERGTLNRDFERMGTTCSALALTPQGAVIGHVGDSRVYRIRHGRIDQLTFDHSLHWELLRQGRMRPEEVYLHEPRHVITRSLGPEPQVQVDIEGPYPILPGDTYVLCSDGLTNHVADAEIGTIAAELPPGEASRMLVNLSNLRGGSDNVTVIVVRVGDLPLGMSPESIPAPATASPLNWQWLAGFWITAIAFVTGISLELLGHYLFGALLILLGGGGLGALIIGWQRLRKRLNQQFSAGDETVLWRPYRTADARLTKRFLNHIAAVQSEMQRAASEERWNIEWDVHEQEFSAAKSHLSSGQHTAAFRALGRAIDVLMMGLQDQRRKVHHDRRWGRVSSETSD